MMERAGAPNNRTLAVCSAWATRFANMLCSGHLVCLGDGATSAVPLSLGVQSA